MRFQRRRSQRYRKDRDARYRPDPQGPWLPCMVIDLSLGGVALEVPAGAQVPGARFEVDICPPSSDAEGFVLRGVVRNVDRLRGGNQRVGVEFVGLTTIDVHVLSDIISIEDALTR